MANYVSATSDKSKKKAKHLLLCGGVGLHYFYVGRIKAGLIHLLIGLFMWVMFIDGFMLREAALIVFGIGFLLAINLYDFVRLSLGKFKDNVGNYLRQ